MSRSYATWSIALASTAIVTPLVLSALDPPVLAYSYGRGHAPFELLGMTGAVALFAVAALEWRRRRPANLAEALPVTLPWLVLLLFLYWVSELSAKPFDYDCYEYAGRVLLRGENPWKEGLIYLYPPLAAQGFALAFRVLAEVAGRFGVAAGEEAIWGVVFYLYQCAQLLLILLTYRLCERLARDAGLASPWSHVLVAALLVFNNPLLRTLRHGQINLWVLDLALLAVVLARRCTPLAGLALALAVHVKIYPALLLLPFAAAGRGWLLFWSASGLALVAALQTDFGRDTTTWQQFLAFYGARFPGEVAFRNASLHSMVFNGLRFLAGGAVAAPRAIAALVASVGAVAGGLWLLARVVARERAFRARREPGEAAHLAAQAADALAFGLLVSPSVWEHHYVLALPLAIEAVSRRIGDRPWAVATGLFLTFAMPTFDLFPLAYHRAVGLLLLLLLTPPRAARPTDTPSRHPHRSAARC